MRLLFQIALPAGLLVIEEAGQRSWFGPPPTRGDLSYVVSYRSAAKTATLTTLEDLRKLVDDARLDICREVTAQRTAYAELFLLLAGLPHYTHGDSSAAQLIERYSQASLPTLSSRLDGDTFIFLATSSWLPEISLHQLSVNLLAMTIVDAEIQRIPHPQAMASP